MMVPRSFSSVTIALVVALVAVTTTVSAQTQPPNPGNPPCYICGSPDLLVTKNDQPLNFQSTGETTTCSDLDFAAKSGFISPIDCASIKAGVTQTNACGCAANTPAPTPAVVKDPPTPQPGTPAPTLAPSSANRVVVGTVLLAATVGAAMTMM